MTGPGEGLAVILIEPAGEALRQLQERTNLSRADIANRALVLYQFVDAELRAGRHVITQDCETGTAQVVELVDALGARIASAAPALSGRGAAGRHVRPARRRRRMARPGGPMRLRPAFSLGGQEVRTT
ncbi:MAG TPA: hypothetical protein VK823_08060 [Streptosporangiaceae bacterium]|jgi:hypothetical protein|nr:hypothetical protein [Streptosporangiaceae bacterium]